MSILTMQYILVDKKVVPASGLDWARWFEEASKDGAKGRRVAEETVGGKWVSTVFLGVDHNFEEPGNPPIVFETMVFGDRGCSEPLYQSRCATWEEAEAMHARVVAGVRDMTLEWNQ